MATLASPPDGDCRVVGNLGKGSPHVHGEDLGLLQISEQVCRLHRELDALAEVGIGRRSHLDVVTRF